MSPTDSVYGSNPRSGEIDITEVRTNTNLSCNGKPYGRQLSGTTLHWGPDAQHNGHRMTYWQKYMNFFYNKIKEMIMVNANYYLEYRAIQISLQTTISLE